MALITEVEVKEDIIKQMLSGQSHRGSSNTHSRM